MNIGWCLPIGRESSLTQTGLNFLEPPLSSLDLLAPGILADAKDRARGCPVPIQAFGSLFPAGLKVVGPSVDRGRVQSYLKAIAELVDATDAKIVVFGDGAARSIPLEFDRGKAEEQLLDCFSWAADSLKGTSAVLAVEPLNRKRSNIINSLAEAVSWVKLLDRPNVGIVADIFHMDEEKEPFSAIRPCIASIVHVHLADTHRRNPGTGHYDYASFFENLKEGGYNGLFSIECGADYSIDEIKFSVDFVCQQWGK